MTKTTETEPRARTKVAFLGLGAMGARMASRLVGDEIDLKVWSRSGVPASATSLLPFAAPTSAEAVTNADIVFTMLTDDEASRAVWLDTGVLRGMRRAAIAVECSTLSPVWAATLAEYARTAGLGFVDAPVVGSRPQAEASSLTFLAGGEDSVVNQVRPILRRMGGAVHHVGASPAGAWVKLIVNSLFSVQVATLAELFGFAEKVPLDLTALVRTLDGLPVLSPSAKAAATGMVARRFEPMFPVALAAKDLRYTLAAAQKVGGTLPVTRSAAAVFERANAEGLRGENLTAVAKLFTSVGHTAAV